LKWEDKFWVAALAGEKNKKLEPKLTQSRIERKR